MILGRSLSGCNILFRIHLAQLQDLSRMQDGITYIFNPYTNKNRQPDVFNATTALSLGISGATNEWPAPRILRAI
jgi:hypothetical protein